MWEDGFEVEYQVFIHHNEEKTRDKDADEEDCRDYQVGNGGARVFCRNSPENAAARR